MAASVRLLPGRALPYLRLSGRYGDEVDVATGTIGTGMALGAGAVVIPMVRLQGDLSGEWRAIDAPGTPTGRLVHAVTSRARVNYAFSPRLSLRGVAQWQRIERGATRAESLTGSLLATFRMDALSVVYMGVDATGAAAPGRASRTLFVKLSRAFRG